MRGLRAPSPAMVVAVIALFASLAGSVYAASKINGGNIKKSSIPGNRIKSDSVTGKQVKESTLGTVPDATNASNAAKLAGATPDTFQPFCKPGSIEGSLVIDPSTVNIPSASYITVGGFNCVGQEVQIKHQVGVGKFYVRFVGLERSGSCVSSGLTKGTSPIEVNCVKATDPNEGFQVFDVKVYVNGAPSESPFSLVAF
jgi:hypothetical protein